MFLALEGPDNSGKSTFCEDLRTNKGYTVISNPYEGPFGYDFVNKMKGSFLNVISKALMYVWYFSEVRDKIALASAEEHNIVLDRYYLSTYIYNCYGAMSGRNIFHKSLNPQRRFVKSNIDLICRAIDNSRTNIGKAICIIALIADCDHELSMFFKDIDNFSNIKETALIIFSEYKENNPFPFGEIKEIFSEICGMINKFLPRAIRLGSSNDEYSFKYCLLLLVDILFDIIDLPEPDNTIIFQEQFCSDEDITDIVELYKNRELLFNTVKGNITIAYNNYCFFNL